MNIFDQEKVDIANAVLKVVIWIAGFVIVCIATKDKFTAASQDLAENASAIENVTVLMEQMAIEEESFDKEAVVLSTISFLVEEKGGKVSSSKIRQSLTEKELSVINEVMESIEFDGRNEETIALELCSKKEVVEYYGLANADKLNAIVKSHEEWYE